MNEHLQCQIVANWKISQWPKLEQFEQQNKSSIEL